MMLGCPYGPRRALIHSLSLSVTIETEVPQYRHRQLIPLHRSQSSETVGAKPLRQY